MFTLQMATNAPSSAYCNVSTIQPIENFQKTREMNENKSKKKTPWKLHFCQFHSVYI